MAVNAATHYENITEMWKEFMGDNFHFGYFETEDTDLPRAARAMVEKMLQPCRVSKESRILDVGCGIGGPAFYIHEHHGCAVDGISTSRKGVETASRIAGDKGCENVRFKVADGVDNGFGDETFDLVWIMEASHLIQDKKALFDECFRVLKPGGRLAMCDLMELKARPPRKGLMRLLASIKHLLIPPKVWGPTYITTMGSLCDQMVGAGFTQIHAVDISKQVILTCKHWRDNAVRFREGDLDESSRQYTDDFIRGCTYLENAFNDGAMKYGMLFADKES
jgi:cyclopropane fatty-acyl-phospholipid synthase-like methyltransferase